MKAKILILFLLVSSLSVFPLRVNADESINVDTQSDPSESLSLVESNKLMNSGGGAASYAISAGEGYVGSRIDAGFSWGDITLPGENGSWGGAGNMGHDGNPEEIPVGDATIPIVISLFALYWIFKGTTSKRKNVM